jgi:hypothetical protein
LLTLADEALIEEGVNVQDSLIMPISRFLLDPTQIQSLAALIAKCAPLSRIIAMQHC